VHKAELLKMLKKIIIALSLFGTQHCWAADTYTPSNNQLNISIVEVAGITYRDVVISVGGVIRIDGGEPSGLVDKYNSSSNQLSIPSVIVNGKSYSNVVISVGEVISIGNYFYEDAIHSSTNEVFPPPSLLDTQNLSGNISANNYTRNIAFGDLNSDGCADVVTAPSYYVNLPNLEIQIWEGDCNGHFTNATNKFITGPVPKVGMATNIFIGDFLNNGKNGVFIVDSGAENLGANSKGFTGGVNHLLIPNNGKLVDVSASNLPSRNLRYNHVSSITGLPGNQRIVLTRMGGPLVGSGGIYIWKNNGLGVFFEEEVSSFPVEFYPTSSLTSEVIDYIQPGTTIVSNLNGNDDEYLITGTYSGGTTQSKTVAVFIYKLINKKYQRIASVPIPNQYSNIGYAYGDTQAGSGKNGLGVSGIIAEDFDKTGRKSIAVIWEGANKTYLQFIKNTGNDIFKDITDESNAGLKFQPYINSPIMQMEAKDIDGDGAPELILRSYQYPFKTLRDWSPVWTFKNGRFNYMSPFGGFSYAQVMSKFQSITDDSLINLFFQKLDSSEKISVIGIETPGFVKSGNFNLPGSSVSHVLVRK